MALVAQVIIKEDISQELAREGVTAVFIQYHDRIASFHLLVCVYNPSFLHGRGLGAVLHPLFVAFKNLERGEYHLILKRAHIPSIKTLFPVLDDFKLVLSLDSLRNEAIVLNRFPVARFRTALSPSR